MIGHRQQLTVQILASKLQHCIVAQDAEHMQVADWCVQNEGVASWQPSETNWKHFGGTCRHLW